MRDFMLGHSPWRLRCFGIDISILFTFVSSFSAHIPDASAHVENILFQKSHPHPTAEGSFISNRNVFVLEE